MTNTSILAKPAWHPIPVFPNAGNSAFEQQFILWLEQQHAADRQVLLIVRGMSGDSVFPDCYRPIIERFGVGPYPLVVHVAYALRHNYVTHADCALPPPPHPFYIPKNDPANARGFHHTGLTNIRAINDTYHQRAAHLPSARINLFKYEEMAARTGAWPPPISQLVKHVRGRQRNRIIAGG